MDVTRGKKDYRFTFPFKMKALLNIFLCPYKLKFSSMAPAEILDYLGAESVKNSSLQDRRSNGSTTSDISIYNETLEGNTTSENPTFDSLKPINMVSENPKAIYVGSDNVKFRDLDLKRLKYPYMAGRCKDDERYTQTKWFYFKNLGLSTVKLLQETSKIDDLIRPRIPQEISWTRVQQNQEKMDKVPLREKVVMGVIASMVATTTVHPIDVIKVRLQLFPKSISTINMLKRILTCEGQKGLYGGLTASWLRQITNTGSRLYVYNSLMENHQRKHGSAPNLSARMNIAIVAGMAGALAGTPADMALVRIIETQRLRRSICSPPCSVACKMFPTPVLATTKIYRIARKYGVATLWRGGLATVIRSVFVSASQVGVYAEVKQAFTEQGMTAGGIKLHVCSAACSSLFSTFLSLPVDLVKTRHQALRQSDPKVNRMKVVMMTKGVMYLWKGFLPYYLRQFIHTVISYVLLDQLIDLYIGLVDPGSGK